MSAGSPVLQFWIPFRQDVGNTGWIWTWMPLSATTLMIPYVCGEQSSLPSPVWFPLIYNYVLSFREGNGSSNSGKGNTNWPLSSTPIELRLLADWHVKLGLESLNNKLECSKLVLFVIFHGTLWVRQVHTNYNHECILNVRGEWDAHGKPATSSQASSKQ